MRTRHWAAIRSLESVSYADFSPSFLNIPKFDDEYYFKKFWSMVWVGFTRTKWSSIPLLALFLLVAWYLLQSGLWAFLVDNWNWLGETFKKIKWW